MKYRGLNGTQYDTQDLVRWKDIPNGHLFQYEIMFAEVWSARYLKLSSRRVQYGPHKYPSPVDGPTPRFMSLGTPLQ